MAAVALQQVGAPLQGAKEVEPAVGPAGALPLAVVLEADHKHRAGVLLGQAGGHDAHHPLVPGLVRQHQAVILLPAGQQGQALVENLQLHRLTLAVELTQLVGQQLGLAVVLGEDELRRGHRPAHPAGGVDPGGETVAHGGGGDGPVQGTRLHHEGVQPTAAGFFQVVQAHPDNGAVLPQKLHHVGHGAHGGQVGVLLEEGAVPLFPPQGHHQFQGHPHPGQILEGIGAVLPVGVHHRHGGGNLLLALVMVGDNHIYAQAAGVGHPLHGGDAAVHGNHQAHPLPGQFLHRLPVDPVALGQAVGDVVAHVTALGAEIMGEQTGGGDAVHVVVAVDCDLLPVAQGAANPGGGQVHVFHQEGVLKLVLPAGEETLGLCQVGHPPGTESGGHQGGDPLPFHGFIGLLGPLCDVPLLVFHDWDLGSGNFLSLLPCPGGAKKEKMQITIHITG